MILPSGLILRSFTRLSFLFLAAFLSVSVRAQQSNLQGDIAPFGVGSATANLGVGVGAPYDGDNGGFGFKLAAEYGIWQAGPGVISLGPEVGMSISSNYHHLYNDNYRGHTLVVAARGAYHYGWGVAGLDTYGGFSFGPGFHHLENKTTGFTDNTTLPIFGAFVGASYFINPQFGFNAEAGFDITNFQVGVIVKLQ